MNGNVLVVYEEPDAVVIDLDGELVKMSAAEAREVACALIEAAGRCSGSIPGIVQSMRTARRP